MKTLFCINGHDTAMTGRYQSGGCKVCTKATSNRWYTHNKDVHLKRIKEHRKLNIEKTKKQDRKGKLRYRFNISPEEHDLLIKKQSNLCAICNKPEMSKKKNLGIDHNHKTGKVRGLLCHTCNTFVVNAVENYPELLEKAKEYLTFYA